MTKTRHIALLRAVNVAGHGSVRMAVLQRLVDRVGGTEVRTILQSGNVVFSIAPGNSEALERHLEQEARRRLEIETEFYVRDVKAWNALVENNPYAKEARDDPGRLVVVVLKRPPTETAVNELRRGIEGRERVARGSCHLYAYYPDGQGRSKLTLGKIERALGSSGTARNWNTVLRLQELAGGSVPP